MLWDTMYKMYFKKRELGEKIQNNMCKAKKEKNPSLIEPFSSNKFY